MTSSFYGTSRFRGCLSDYKEKIRLRAQRTKPEMSRLCRPPFLPPFLSARLGRVTRRKMANMLTASRISSQEPVEVHLYLENAVEIVIKPKLSGLSIKVWYHSHPWLSKDAGAATVIHDQCIGWRDVLDRHSSTHDRLAWISKIPEMGVAHIDMSCVDAVDLDFGPLNTLIERPGGLGLLIRKSGTDVEDDPGASSTLLLNATSEEISAKIIGLAKTKDEEFRSLHLIKRFLLDLSSDLGPIFHHTEDALSRLIQQKNNHP
jgi:hypothetical protein